MKDSKLSPAELQAYMQVHSIPGEFIFLKTPTPTVETAAQAVGTNPEQIVKSILFLIEGNPILAITCGPAHVDRRTLASFFTVGRKRVKLASPEAVLQMTGFEVGAMPPFGHHFPLLTMLDWRVLEKSVIYAGGGAENALLRLAPQDILQTTRARVIDLLIPQNNPPQQVD